MYLSIFVKALSWVVRQPYDYPSEVTLEETGKFGCYQTTIKCKKLTNRVVNSWNVLYMAAMSFLAMAFTVWNIGSCFSYKDANLHV